MRNTCLNMVHALAKQDKRVVFVGSDLSPGLLSGMQEEMPERYYMEGIAEQNVIGLTAGLAMEGFMPYVNTIATFITRRCYEQVAVDLCLHDLPVRLIGNGGGLVYAPLGPTHLAIEDIAIMRALPRMSIVAVADAEEMKALMRASLAWDGPLYIRLAKGGDPIIFRPETGFTIGRAVTMRRAETRHPVAFMSTGVMTTHCLMAAEKLAASGIDASVLHVHTVKPIDDMAVLEHAANAVLVVTVEEGVANGGFGSAIADTLVMKRARKLPPILRLALADAFPQKYGTQADLLELNGLMPDQIVSSTARALGHEGLAQQVLNCGSVA
jgi:transketolase